MNDNEYKIKYESIEEFCRMASGNIARWEEQLSEIEGCLKRLLNMETFQGESADAIRAYIQEVHITLVSAIRQCLREYSTRLLMYQSEYYKIDSDKDACLSEKEISDIRKHLQKQEEFLLERDESIRGILDEISDILPLPVPSQEKLLSDIGEVIKKSNKLNVDVRCYESEKAKEVTEEFTPLTESIKKAIQKYTGQERQLYGYASGDADKVQEIAELNKKVMQSNWYMIDNGADIQAALKEKREQVEENQPVWYSQKYNAEEPDMHLILDLAGMMPAAGAVFDGINATWYLAEGDYTNAALSGMALIPVVGEFAGAGKAGLKGLKCADDIADAVKALDNTKDVAKAVDDMSGTAKYLDDVIESGLDSGLTQSKIEDIINTPKGSRPDPSSYLSQEYIDAHLAQFDDGVSVIQTEWAYSRYSETNGFVGVPDDNSLFVMPKNYCDDVIARANGNISIIEKKLGFPEGYFSDGGGLIRIDALNTSELNIRIPSGNETGANKLWIPGGKTSGGVPEAITNTIPLKDTTITRINVD